MRTLRSVTSNQSGFRARAGVRAHHKTGQAWAW
jgi:hypothetical protein